MLAGLASAANAVLGVGPLLSGGLDLLGGIFQQNSASDQVKQQENFQEQMSNTAYQRATVDMSKAGINPLLAYSQGGASTPPGASYQPQNVLGPAAGQFFATAQQQAQTGQSNAQTDLIQEQQTTQQHQQDLIDAQIDRTYASSRQIESTLPKYEAIADMYKKHPWLALVGEGSGIAKGVLSTAKEAGGIADEVVNDVPLD